MPLPFSLICDLLDECHRLSLARRPSNEAVQKWFARHRGRIDAHDTDLSALLSALLPEKRTDRVFCIQVPRLEKIIGRALMLGSSRVSELARYKQPGLGLDLADCVERILTTTPNPRCARQGEVSVEEIDNVLHALASQVRWSSPAIRSQAPAAQCHPDTLARVYRRLGAREAKWLTRLVLKDFKPLILESSLVYCCCHPLLPHILKIHDDFAAAIKVIRGIRGTLLPNSTSVHQTSRTALLSLKPQLGVKVGRQNWFKARSIKHCVNMAHGCMSVENKIDGEYCQIHVDNTGQSPTIQIFSKSGKDSTEDRKGLRGVIATSLQLGLGDSKIEKDCILEGELVVYSDVEHKILPFHKIRNHVARRGRFINTESDSPPKPWENLMVVYYDLLLLNGRSLLDVRHSERFRLLEQVVFPSRGRAELVPRRVVDFGHRFAASELRKAFANVIMNRGEGLVLKADEPYFNFHQDHQPFGGRCIKLKKEYIGTFGDVGDFAVVGAGFAASKAKTYGIANLRYTHFYLGCLDNREQVQRWNATPEFTVVSVVELNEDQLETLVKFGNPTSVPVAENVATELKIPKGIETGPPLTIAFCNPLVFDLRCFSFDKPGNTGFWTLRFPCVSKIHFDRDFCDAVSFEELQNMAKEATTTPELEDSQENLAWIARLEGADPWGLPVDAVSQITATTVQTPSPMKSVASTAGRDPSASPAVASQILQACIRPGRVDGFACVQERVIPATPRMTIMAPPLLPPPREATPRTGPGDSPRKRVLALSAGSSPPSKRRRPAEPEAATASQFQNGPRRPLIDVDGNASQHIPRVDDSDATAHSPSKCRHENDRQRLLMAPLVDVERPISQTTASISIDSGACEGVTSCVLERESSPPHRPDSSFRRRLETTAGVRVGCSYAGTTCCMAKFDILVAPPLLTESTEPEQLLKAHDVFDAATSVDQWAQPSGAGNDPLTSLKSERAKMLLIDCVDDATGARNIVARIEKARAGILRRQRDSIIVYDWRVLRHATILEDESITNKYYDGFHDPWRRWYCGII